MGYYFGGSGISNKKNFNEKRKFFFWEELEFSRSNFSQKISAFKFGYLEPQITTSIHILIPTFLQYLSRL